MEQLLEKWKSEQMNQLLLRSHFIVSFFFPHLSIITPTLCRALVSKRNSIEGRSLSTKPFLLLMTPKQHLHQSPTSPKPPPMDPIPALLWTKNSSTEFSEKWSNCQMLLKFPDFEKKNASSFQSVRSADGSSFPCDSLQVLKHLDGVCSCVVLSAPLIHHKKELTTL